MREKERGQIIGLEILKPDDPTLWKRALKSGLGRTAKKREPIFSGRGLLSGIWDRIKKSR
jgi:hypothetical protein